MKKSLNRAENFHIKDYKDFINIEGNYGAYQNWLFTEKFKKKFWADRACGIAAAGNVAYYLTKNHKKELYDYEELSIKEFTLFLNDIYKYIKPRVYGIPTIYHMKRGFIRFCRDKGVMVKAETANIRLTKDSIIGFIKKALKNDYPIMMLTWNTRQPHLKYHWVTIIGYFIDDEGNNFVTTSNWGSLEVFNFDNWIDQKSFYKGLVYFK